MANERARFAVCVRNEGYEASLELHKIYRIVSDPQGDDEGDVRVIDESGEDYLYPAEWFVPIELPETVHTLSSPGVMTPRPLYEAGRDNR